MPNKKQQKPFSIKRLQRGVTLVELMVAMTIGLFISAGIISLYLGTSQTYRSTEARGFVQETGRFALEYISQHVRQAGYMENPDPEQPWDKDYIFGWESGGNSFSNQKSNTDSIQIKHSAGEVSNSKNSKVTRIYSFYVGSDSGEVGLFLKINENESELLISNIVDMQIQYATGERIMDFTRPILTNQYRSADQLNEEDWENVFAAKISILVKSEQNNIVETPMVLYYNNQKWDAPDNALYQVFTGYISIRNRLP